jgi:hypothetical protein
MADKEGIATNLNPRDRPFDTAYFLGLDLGRRRSRANATHMTKRHSSSMPDTHKFYIS